MKFKGSASISRIAVCTALCAAFGAAQAATMDECRQAVGFPVFSGSTDTGAWAVVSANAEAFTARNVVKTCAVDYKVQEGGKGKPTQVYYPVPVDGTMVKDLCTTYGELGAIDSDLSLIKFQSALDKASALADKLLTLRDTDKLTFPGYSALATLGNGVDKVVACLNELVNQ